MTLWSTVWLDELDGFDGRVRVLRRADGGRRRVARSLLGVRRGDSVLLNGAPGAGDLWFDLLLGIALRLRGGVGTVISDATWHPRSPPGEAHRPGVAALAAAVNRGLLRLADGPHAHVCFLSATEVDDYVRERGADPERVHLTLFSHTVWSASRDELRQAEADLPTTDRYVFAGGNSSRDYRLLVDALHDLPVRVRVATQRTPQGRPWPPAFEVGPVSHEEFMRQLAGSSVVVVPMPRGMRRSVGQQTYLNAMLLGRPTVVTDSPGVRDHVRPGVDCLVVPPGDAASLRRAVEQLLDSAGTPAGAELTAEARRTAEQRSPAAYAADLERLLALARPRTRR